MAHPVYTNLLNNFCVYTVYNVLCLNIILLWCRPDGYLFDKEAILEYILHQKRDISKKLKEFEKQKTKQQVQYGMVY